MALSFRSQTQGRKEGVWGRDRWRCWTEVQNRVTPDSSGMVGAEAVKSQVRLCTTAQGLFAWTQEGQVGRGQSRSVEKTNAARKAAPSPPGPRGRLPGQEDQSREISDQEPTCSSDLVPSLLRPTKKAQDKWEPYYSEYLPPRPTIIPSPGTEVEPDSSRVGWDLA